MSDFKAESLKPFSVVARREMSDRANNNAGHSVTLGFQTNENSILGYVYLECTGHPCTKGHSL